MGGLRPGEEVDEAVLQDESYAYASVEAAEVGRHGCDGEVGSCDIGARSPVFDTR